MTRDIRADAHALALAYCYAPVLFPPDLPPGHDLTPKEATALARDHREGCRTLAQTLMERGAAAVTVGTHLYLADHDRIQVRTFRSNKDAVKAGDDLAAWLQRQPDWEKTAKAVPRGWHTMACMSLFFDTLWPEAA